MLTGNWLDQPNEEKVLKHAGARTILERKAFEERGVQDIRDALNQIPACRFRKQRHRRQRRFAEPRRARPRLTPFAAFDGSDGWHPALLRALRPAAAVAVSLTLGNVDTVDVVRGAGSVRYGPQNVGGIINFVTHPIPDDPTVRFGSGTEIAGNNGHVKATPTFFLGGTNDDGLGAALLYSGIHGEGYRDNNDRSDIDDLILKGKYEISDTDTLSLQYHHYSGEGKMPGGLTSAEYADDRFQSTRRWDDFSGHRNDISLRYQHNDGENNFEVLAYYVNSFRGSHVEQQGTGASAGLYRLTSAPREYEYFGIEPRLFAPLRTG